MKAREFPRLKRRINCKLEVDGQGHVGVALDISPKGFFVQTAASPSIGANVAVTLHHADLPEISVQGSVRNKKVVPSRLAAVARGGVGVSISLAPEEYYQLLGSLSGSGSSSGGTGPSPEVSP